MNTMQTHASHQITALAGHVHSSASPFQSARRNPPAHVRRWTGRAQLTLPLPDLAMLRLQGGAQGRAFN